MRLRLEAATRIPPARLYAWWTDFQEGHHDHAFLGAHAEGVGRRILARREGAVEIEDNGRFMGVTLVEHYTAHLRPDVPEVSLHGANNLSRFSAVYRFEPGRVVLDATIAPLGGLALMDWAGKPLVRAFLKRDLEGHVADAEKDLLAAPAPASAREARA